MFLWCSEYIIKTVKKVVELTWTQGRDGPWTVQIATTKNLMDLHVLDHPIYRKESTQRLIQCGLDHSMGLFMFITFQVWYVQSKKILNKLDSGPSTRAQKEIGRVRLSDSVVSLINNQSKCIIACLANGTIALIKSKNSLWDFSTSAIKIIDFGAPHHAIGCSILVEKNSQLWCGYRFEQGPPPETINHF